MTALGHRSTGVSVGGREATAMTDLRSNLIAKLAGGKDCGRFLEERHGGVLKALISMKALVKIMSKSDADEIWMD